MFTHNLLLVCHEVGQVEEDINTMWTLNFFMERTNSGINAEAPSRHRMVELLIYFLVVRYKLTVFVFFLLRVVSF